VGQIFAHLTVSTFPDKGAIRNTVKNWRLQPIDGESKNEKTPRKARRLLGFPIVAESTRLTSNHSHSIIFCIGMSLNLKEFLEANGPDTVRYTVTGYALKKSPSPPACWSVSYWSSTFPWQAYTRYRRHCYAAVQPPRPPALN
jgi:hypothetical protein